MVSLGNDSRRVGGYFFDQEASGNQEETDDLLLDLAVLGTLEEPVFRSIKTVPIIAIQIAFLFGFELLIFLLPYTNPESLNVFSILIYTHASLWVIFFILDRFLCYQHQVSRRNGYLEFYRKTLNARKWPLVVLSAGNVVLLVIVTLVKDLCAKNGCDSLKMHPYNYIQILVSLEVISILPRILFYLVDTVKFNQSKTSPDVQQEELVSSYLNSHMQSSEIGFRDEDYLDEVMEKQADMIRYLKQHNANLGKKVLKLTMELNAFKISSSSHST